MSKEYLLTPEELCYLGTLFPGARMSYRYIAMMDDIQQDKKGFRLSCQKSLAEKGVLELDFFGSAELSEEARALAEPVFHETFQSAVEVETRGDEPTRQAVQFHWMGTDCTAVVFSGKQLLLRKVTVPELEALVFSLLPEGYNERDYPGEVELDSGNITRLIAVKNLSAEKGSNIKVFTECDGWLCVMQEDQTAEIYSPRQFFEDAMQMLKGA